MMKIVVFTNDTHVWLLQGFQYLFNKYWDPEQSVTVAGYSHPSKFGVKLERNFEFFAIDDHNYPANRWSNGLIKYLEACRPAQLIVMLEDYWLSAPVDRKAVAWCYGFMEHYHSKVLRIDLSADRLSNKLATDFGVIGNGLELAETPAHSKYQMSFQAAVWSGELLHEALSFNESPWEAEIEGTKRLSQRPYLRVLGTKSPPLLYKPVYRSHRKTLDMGHLSDEEQRLFAMKGWV